MPAPLTSPPDKPLRIALLEPFLTGSHRYWAEGFKRFSRHAVHLFHRSGAHWKWRMRGAAVSMWEELREEWEAYDAILATDMLDLAAWRGLMSAGGFRLPCMAYFHENQLTYPWSPTDQDPSLGRDRHYAYTNYTTALAADVVAFNSAYHREAFLGALPGFLDAFPDDRNRDLPALLRRKSAVLHPGLDFTEILSARAAREPGPPVVVWNHRMEYDKAPETFFHALFRLSDAGFDFRLVVLGESFRQQPAIAEEARMRLARHVMHWGYCADRREYLQWLWKGDLLPVTARQDFFGYSVAEALATGITALLPNRLAYPEHRRPGCHYYTEESDFLPMLERLVSATPERSAPGTVHDWSQLAPEYDRHLREMCAMSFNAPR